MTLQDLNADIKGNLRRMAYDDQAYGNLLRAKKDLNEWIAKNHDLTEIPEVVTEAAYLLRDIPAGATCACCGYEGLVNIHHKDGQIVGPECAGHPIGTCKGARSA